MKNLTSWIYIDLDALSYNIKVIKDFIGTTKMLAVVKADAYGHGIIPVALTALDSGADYIGVSDVDEAILLRKSGIKAPILVFNTILPEHAEKAVKFNLTITVCSLDVVQALHEAAKRLNTTALVHIKVDTGFGRFGILPEHALGFVKIVYSDFKAVYVEGIYTHFSSPSSSNITWNQFNKFNDITNQIREAGFIIPLRHACNSTAAVQYPKMHLDMVRIGNLMYGLCSSGNLNLKKLARVFSKIIFIKNLPAGHNVGYGNKYATKRSTTIAVIPFGYYEGLGLIVSQPSGLMDALKILLKQLMYSFGVTNPDRKVVIKNRMFNIIGKIGMQNCMIDITDFRDDISVGDYVEISTRKVNLCYSLPRVYHRGNEIFVDTRQCMTYLDMHNQYIYDKGSEQSIG
ncbi:MAG: alanine racemase [Tepidanaerobacteraceae bacterium]|nr:alanine racemase [Tepidanaerobacteraceae bacterium]